MYFESFVVRHLVITSLTTPRNCRNVLSSRDIYCLTMEKNKMVISNVKKRDAFLIVGLSLSEL